MIVSIKVNHEELDALRADQFEDEKQHLGRWSMLANDAAECIEAMSTYQGSGDMVSASVEGLFMDAFKVEGMNVYIPSVSFRLEVVRDDDDEI